MIDDATRKQVAAQCRAVEHMATAIAQVHSDLAKMLEAGPGPWDETVEIRGKFTASRMETLGDMLNGMDAVEKEDAWINPIMKEAQRRWPTQRATQ